ncbi:hypothetical protein [Sinorhizobium sp. CCBAU 05631]|uniref:hypothetical protein n=1 Tax=Sinorhizobium sp. CCBAU 05631 TaxID=794846 RepID=UPI0004B14F4F|nr:hypothetical protein [Sinorhizobium sp. CCBAU 05631]ASY61392.1 hypothetical protein SS05631_d64910 [Sinorhizobium sp. CCBAU 05631]
MPVDFWDIIPGTYLLVALCVGIAALWPPLGVRRLVMALTLVVGSGAVAIATFTPTITLPTHFVVVAECKAFENRAAFEDSLSKPLGDRPFLSEVTYLVLSDPGCSDPSRGAIKLAGRDLRSAMTAAGEAFDTTPFYNRWRANRLMLVGVPGGPLSEERGVREEEIVSEYLGMVESLRASVEYHEIGDTPDRRLTVTAPIWRATPVGRNSVALRLDFAADHITDARRIELQIVQHALTPDCQVTSSPRLSTNQPPYLIDANLLSGADAQRDDVRVERPNGPDQGRRLIVTVAYLDLIADNVSKGICKDNWWSFIDITATVSLPDGEVVFRGGTALGRASEPMLTLYTPRQGSIADQHAAAGWEMGAADLVAPDPGWGVSKLLETISQEGRAKAASDKDWAIRSPWRTLWRSFDCWFQGPDDLLARPEEFRQCLGKSRRLAVVSPSADAIRALDSFEIQQLVEAGALNTLVAAPEYSAREAGELPAWAVPATPMLPPTVSMPLIVASPTANGLLIRGAGAKPNLQETVLESLVSPGVAGSAEASASCAAASEPISTQRSLFWFAPQSPLIAVPPVSSPAPSHPQIRLRGLLETVAPSVSIFPKAFDENAARGRLGSEGTFKDNLQCDNPIKRTIDAIVQLEQSGLYRPGTSRVPRAAVLLFDTNQPAPRLLAVPKICDNGDPGRYDPPVVQRRLKEFINAGGRILVQPIIPSIEFDSELYKDAAARIGGTLFETTALLREQLSNGLMDAVAPLPQMSSKEDPATVARVILAKMESNWNARPLSGGLVAASVDYGTLGTRNAACALDLAAEFPGLRYHCLHTPLPSGRLPFANALNRTGPAPEFFGAFGPRAEDRLVSGQLQLGDGSVLRQVVQIGRGRSVILGYSPFARDQLAHDFIETPHSARLKRGLCFLMDGGTGTVYNRVVTKEDNLSGTFPRDGGMEMLDRFAQSLDQPIDAPVLDTIVDRDVATGAFTLVAYAHSGRDSAWKWRLDLDPADASAAPFAPGTEPASLILQSFNPRTGEARIRVEPRTSGYRGAVAMTLSDPPAGPPIILPLDFPQQLSTIDLSKVITLLNTNRSSSARLTIDASAASVLVLIICALVMFSPLARNWAAAGALLDRWRRRILSEASLPPRAAPLLSLEAALSEWGAHPGQPAAARNAGLPAGFRQWRAGDAGRAIIPASLYGVLGRGAVVPPMKPRVRLKTSSQATSVLVLLEGTGALAFPTARNSPSKSDYAATLAAFLVGAVTMSHGRAEVARVGGEAVLTADPNQLCADIPAVLDQPPSFTPPADHVRKHGGAALVFFVADGLSINRHDLVAMADELGVDGNRLRVAAIVSNDDRYGATLFRDPRNGAFEDASEVHPATFVRLRDQRLEAARFELERHGAQLVVFPAEATTQETLRRLNESGFLA